MTLVLRSIPAIAIVLILAAAAAAPANAQSLEVPYKTLMQTTRAHAVVAAFDRASFEAAEASYPSDEAGGHMTVRTGNYMLWKITHLFASDRRVERIALPAFRQICILRKTQYASTVICRVNATFAVTQGGETRRFNLIGTRNVGRFVTPKPGEDMSVVYSGIAANIDDAVKGLAVQLRRMGAL
jgi:hypothetical protein